MGAGLGGKTARVDPGPGGATHGTGDRSEGARERSGAAQGPGRVDAGWGASPLVGEMGRSPRSPQSDQTDPVGVELGLHCPDRSWWRAQKPRTPKRGDPGRPDARTELREEPLRAGGERNCFEAERVKPSESEPDAAGPWFAPPLPRATPLRCRCAPREERLTANHPKNFHNPVDNPHRSAAAHG